MTSAMISISAPDPRASLLPGVRSEKATLTLRDDDQQVLHCQFNPTEYTISKSARWVRVAVRGASSTARPEFVGTDAGSLQLELFFDARDADEGTVAGSVNRLLSWTRPTPESMRVQRPSPPVIIFEWGGSALFEAYVSSASARFVLFNRDGAPLRAHVSLRLEEVPTPPPTPTNPTSTGTSLLRLHRTVVGESLPLMAHRAYGRADRWRSIAEASGIDDPTRLRPGMALLIPEVLPTGRERSP